MYKDKINYLLGSIIILLLLVIVGIVLYNLELRQNNFELENENILYKTLLKTNGDMNKISIDSQKAAGYYDEASFFYEIEEYTLTESNCRLAREYYSKESQSYKGIKSELIDTGIEDKLIEIYIDLMESNIKITDNMFEACEHFESAARYYNRLDYTMGGEEINMMNEKIRTHDEAVGEYNQYMEDQRLELKNRLK